MTDFAENLGEPSPTWLTSISTKKSLVKVVQTTFFHGFIAFFHEKWRKFNFRNLHTCATLSAIKNLSFNNNHLCKLISWQVSETGCQPFGPLFAKTYFLGIHHLQKNGFSATVFWRICATHKNWHFYTNTVGPSAIERHEISLWRDNHFFHQNFK